MKRVFDISLTNWYYNFFPITFIFCFSFGYKILESFICIEKNWEKLVEFNLIKLRSMILNADKSRFESTSNNDQRITKSVL